MDEPWVWAIILLLAVLLFGSKRLPDAARGIGRSLRIFKAETKGLLTDDAAELPLPRSHHRSRSPRQLRPSAAPVPVCAAGRSASAGTGSEPPAPVAVPVTGVDQPDPQ